MKFMKTMAKPVSYVTADTVFDITVLAFGDEAAEFSLYEDDFISFAYENQQTMVVLKSVNRASRKCHCSVGISGSVHRVQL